MNAESRPSQYRLYQPDEGGGYDVIGHHDDASPYDVIGGSEARSKPGALDQKIYKDDWNERFQAANELPESELKTLALNQVCADFVSTASTYAECLVREQFIPSGMRVLSTAKLGGVAGGVKFKFRGILFKLCQDKQTGGGYIYGGRVEDSELAAKAAGHELKSTCIAFHGCQELRQQSPDSLPLTTTMMCLVDYLGLRLIAMPELPLGNNGSSLRYGSANGGNSYQADPQFHSRIRELANHLHLAAHKVRSDMGDLELYTTGDVEGHQGSDNRAYLLDLARLFPPEAPAEKMSSGFHLTPRGQSFFYRLLRPELLLRLKTAGHPALSGDTWSLWSSKSDSSTHKKNALLATQFLLQQVIPEFAKKVDETPSLLKGLPSAVLHRHGINLRHLGLLRSLVQKEEVKTLLFIETLARTLKQLLRKLLRKSLEEKKSDTALRVDVAQFLNAMSFEPDIWAKISNELTLRFGQVSLLDQERDPDSFRIAGERALSQVFKKLFVMAGITLINTPVDKVGVGFQFTPEDFVLGMRVKHFDVMDWSAGTLLFKQADSSRSYSPHASRLRLYQLMDWVPKTNEQASLQTCNEQVSSQSYLPHASRLRLYQLSAQKFAACVATSPENVKAEVRSVLAALRVTTDSKEVDCILLESLKALDWSPDAKHQLLYEAGKIWTQRPPTYPDGWNYFHQMSGLADVRIDIFGGSNLFTQVPDEEKPTLLKFARWDCVDPKDGKTALHKACEMNIVEAVRDHLAQKADPDVQDQNGETPLHCCFSADNIELIRILLEANADLDVQNAWRLTPPQMAPFQFPFDELGISCPSVWSSRRPFIRCTDKTVLLGVLIIGALCGAGYVSWFSSSRLEFWISAGLIWTALSIASFIFYSFCHSLPFPRSDRANLLHIQIKHGYVILLVLGAMVVPPSEWIVPEFRFVLRAAGFALIVVCTGLTWHWKRPKALFVTLLSLSAIFVMTTVQRAVNWTVESGDPVSKFCFFELLRALALVTPYKALKMEDRKRALLWLFWAWTLAIGYMAAYVGSISTPLLIFPFFLACPLVPPLILRSVEQPQDSEPGSLRSNFRLEQLGIKILRDPKVWSQEQKLEQLDQGRARLLELISEWQSRPLSPRDWILFKQLKEQNLPELEQIQLDIFSVSEYELSIFDLFPEDRKELLLRAKPEIADLEGRTPLMLAIEFQLDDVARLLKERYPQQNNVKDIYGHTAHNYCDPKRIVGMNRSRMIVSFILSATCILIMFFLLLHSDDFPSMTSPYFNLGCAQGFIWITQYLLMFLTSSGSLSQKTAQILEGSAIIFVSVALLTWFVYAKPSALIFATISPFFFFELWRWLWTFIEIDWIRAFDLTLSFQRRDCVLFILIWISIVACITLVGLIEISLVNGESALTLTGSVTLGFLVLHVVWWYVKYPKINFTPWRNRTDRGPIQVLSKEEFVHLIDCRAKHLSKLRRRWIGSNQAPETPWALSALKWLAQRQLIERYPLCIRFASPLFLEVLKLNQPIGNHTPRTQVNEMQSPLLSHASNIQ